MRYLGFPKVLIAKLLCQSCRGPLRASSQDEYLLDAQLTCGMCPVTYKISGGILHMLDEKALDEVLKSEVTTRDEYAQGYDKKLSSRYEKEVISTLREVGDVTGKNVIEYGAGTGRLTMLLAPRSPQYLACDFSLESLRLLAQKEVPASVGLVCADATQLVTADEGFDIAVATQFYEHIPTQELRNDFLSHVYDTLRIGGKFVSTTYHYDLRRRLLRKPQEGMHMDTIFYHYFSIKEIKNDLEKFFQIEGVFPIDITLPLEAKLRIPGKIGGYISRLCERIPLLNLFGHLVLCVASRKG